MLQLLQVAIGLVVNRSLVWLVWDTCMYMYISATTQNPFNIYTWHTHNKVIFSAKKKSLNRPSDTVQLKNANYAKFSGEIVGLERPIVW